MSLQQEFDENYITVTELSEMYDVTVYMISYLRKHGRLCESIKVGATYIFPRNGQIFNVMNQYVQNRRARN